MATDLIYRAVKQLPVLLCAADVSPYLLDNLISAQINSNKQTRCRWSRGGQVTTVCVCLCVWTVIDLGLFS